MREDHQHPHDQVHGRASQPRSGWHLDGWTRRPLRHHTRCAAATSQDRFGTASVVLPSGTTIADLDKCAYLVKLSVTLLLTTGDGVPDPIGDEVAFCK